jgi:phage head maturation protease
MSDQQGYIIEFHRVGNALKVSAFDPETLIEVSIVGDPAVGDAALTRIVIRKLEFMMAKRAAQGDDGQGGNR